ncbi:SHOCT domain-containing protein [Bacillus toyonensis]|uniref:SHOCT domain-containing protein n=1 Tax=Bacillus toyonensis TaxID=155322 RepID=UPI00211D40E0|nr:SHOCT domain-containing protein [Bacillus toyonensis]
MADEILKYKDLLYQGIITEEEFQAKKKQLLGIKRGRSFERFFILIILLRGSVRSGIVYASTY